MERLSEGGIDAVVLDLTLPDSSGLETFTRLHAVADKVPTVIYTSVDDEELSLSALDHGAADYMVKSEVNAAWLARSLIYSIQRHQPTQVVERADHSENPDEPESVDGAAEEDTQLLVATEKSSDSATKWIVTPGEERLVRIQFLEQMRSSLMSLLRQSDCDEAYVDLSHVEYIGNAAIGMLLAVHQRCAAANTKLVLSGMKPQVYEQLSSRRFDKVFNIERP